MKSRPMYRINICIGVAHQRNCEAEIRDNHSYLGVKIMITKEKLTQMETQNYDIAIVQLDRDVLLGSDMSPVCLDQQLTNVGQEHDTEDPIVYISGESTKLSAGFRYSLMDCKIVLETTIYFLKPQFLGFGITFYRKNRTHEVPECSTNHFLPRPYHSKNIYYEAAPKYYSHLLFLSQPVRVLASQRSLLPLELELIICVTGSFFIIRNSLMTTQIWSGEEEK